MSLDALEARLRQDFALLNLPPANWVPPRPDGALDVLVLGAGMLGITAGFTLQRLGILRHRLLDAAPAGQEGPWVTYARMQTLRSPKHLVGPAQDIPALTFRAWHTAQFGEAGWQALGKIPRPLWMDYLIWLRRVLALPVTNEIRATRIGPGPGGLIAVETDREGTLLARHVVLATGRDGLGGPRWPDWAPATPGPRIRHSRDAVDFAALAGQVVAVVGASASAVDNAAMALEAGAAEVHLLVRRPALPVLNRFKSMVHAGFTHGLPGLDDAGRLAVLQAAFEGSVAPPRESVLRLVRHAGFRLHLATPVRAVAEDAAGVTLHLPGGTLRAAMLILGTGFAIDLARRPELAPVAPHVRLWSDAWAAAGRPAAQLGEFATYPHLGPGFELTERTPGTAPWLARLHAFNIGAMASLGLVSGDIPGVGDGGRRLGEAIARALFLEDRAAHLAAIRAYAEPELLGDEIPPAALAVA
ncbi:NAD(P)-binding domain-containing protein [Falsiroseomonas selenitidurans]|uniref:NAD(P)-binding domain-containing protein n=1 Tax=Falsiroseomonas selenitidurans TaxID=2716335 RepID=UPI001ADE76D9|nr:NAD(P)/FAD-dependent oxidoreductase [Falsiroseomonas selenitidurans]